MKIRAATEKDIEFCAELDAKTFNEDKNIILDEFRKKLKDKDYVILVCEEDYEQVGFCTFVVVVKARKAKKGVSNYSPNK